MGLIWTVVNVKIQVKLDDSRRHFDGQKRHTGCDFDLSVYANIASDPSSAVEAILADVVHTCRECDEKYLLADIPELFSYVQGVTNGSILMRLEECSELNEGDTIIVQEWSDVYADRDLEDRSPSLVRARNKIM